MVKREALSGFIVNGLDHLLNRLFIRDLTEPQKQHLPLQELQAELAHLMTSIQSHCCGCWRLRRHFIEAGPREGTLLMMRA